MIFRIQHETRLTYTAPVSDTVFEVRMAPPTDDEQTVLGYRLQVTPAAPLTTFRDGLGNRVELFTIHAPYRELSLVATSFVRAHRRSPRERLLGVAWPLPASLESMEFLQTSPLVDSSPALDAFVGGLGRPSGSLVDVIESVLSACRSQLEYEKAVTTPQTLLSEALRLGRGVCQDFAHLFVGTCRALGMPARYASGYVYHPGEIETHAWCQVWAGESVGWIDVDPTRAEFVGNDHVVVAVGRDYSDVPPNRGVWQGEASEAMDVKVTVEPVERVPRDWAGWAPPAARGPALGANGSPARRKAASSKRSRVGVYPNQPRPRESLLRQQGQQQQQIAG